MNKKQKAKKQELLEEFRKHICNTCEQYKEIGEPCRGCNKGKRAC